MPTDDTPAREAYARDLLHRYVWPLYNRLHLWNDPQGVVDLWRMVADEDQATVVLLLVGLADRDREEAVIAKAVGGEPAARTQVAVPLHRDEIPEAPRPLNVDLMNAELTAERFGPPGWWTS